MRQKKYLNFDFDCFFSHIKLCKTSIFRGFNEQGLILEIEHESIEKLKMTVTNQQSHVCVNKVEIEKVKMTVTNQQNHVYDNKVEIKKLKMTVTHQQNHVCDNKVEIKKLKMTVTNQQNQVKVRTY